MAQNKNAQVRYKALDKCFANQYKRFYIADLIDYCSEVLSEYYGMSVTVSRRQIFDDIAFMKSEAGFDAPIENIKDGRRVYYRYEDPDFSILKMPLNPSEKNSLSEALETLSRINNIPGFDWVSSIQAKLNSGLDHVQDRRQIISFEDNEFLKGLEFLNPLYHSISHATPLHIGYQSYNATEKSTFKISPYYLKQYNTRWFLLGYNHEVQKLQNLALDRIVDISVADLEFNSCDVDFDLHFEDIIGVTNNLEEEPVEIILEMSDNIIPYIVSKPLHGSQKVKGKILSLELKINYELESLILSFGENLTVLKPSELANKIKWRVQSLNKNYACTSTAQ